MRGHEQLRAGRIGDAEARPPVRTATELPAAADIPWARQASSSGPSQVEACLTGLFDARSRQSWRKAQRDRELRQFVIIERGFAVAETEGGLWPLAAGSVLSLPPGAPHAVRFSRGARGRVIKASEAMLLSRVWPILPTPSPALWRIYVAPEALRYWEGPARRAAREQLFHELDAASKHLLPSFEGVVMGYVFVLLFRWMEPLITRTSERGDLMLLDRFRGLVEHTYRQHRTVASYCDELGVSKSRLTRTCAENAGRSPLEIVHDRLLLEAQRELIYSDASIAEIAARLGFGDPNYFVRFFGKRIGVSPTQFRASGGETDKDAAQRRGGETSAVRKARAEEAHIFNGAT